MGSLSFNGVDLSEYNLIVLGANRDEREHQFGSVQLEDKAYAGRVQSLPLNLSLDIAVVGNKEDVIIIPPIVAFGIKNLLTYIKKVLNEREPQELILDRLPDRYWLAKFKSLKGEYLAPGYYRGNLTFFCEDPRSFYTTESIANFNIDANPKTVYEGLGGTAYVEPVYLLTAGDNLPAVTILIENVTTMQQLSWQGSLVIGDELQVDVAHWLVTKNGYEDMGDVGGEFPRLIPGPNAIKVTGFGTNGTLQLTYRLAFL